MTRTRLFPLIMFVWLTIGYTAFHLTACSWAGMAMKEFLGTPDTGESLFIKEDGEALIQKSDGNRTVTYRRLDGEVVRPIGLQPATADWWPNLKRASTASSIEPYSWAQRIESFADFQTPATSWYLILPPNRGGRAYFVGYDPRSRQKVGYIGTKGYSDSLPDAIDWFSIRTSSYLGFHRSVVTVQSQIGRSGPTELKDGGYSLDHDSQVMANASLDQMWVLSEGTLYEICLRSRSVRTLFVNRPEYQFLASSIMKTDEKSYYRLVLRSQTELLMIDPESGQTTSFSIDQLPGIASERIFPLKNGKVVQVQQVFAQWSTAEHRNEITWLNADGQVERRAEVTSYVNWGKPPVDINVALATAFPVPIVAYGAWLISPIIPDEILEDQSYFGNSIAFISKLYGWIVITSLTGFMTGWACRRRERDVFGSASWLWPVVVGLFGWFGWISYLCLRPLPARLPNHQWIMSTPDAPTPVGTEIFA